MRVRGDGALGVVAGCWDAGLVVSVDCCRFCTIVREDLERVDMTTLYVSFGSVKRTKFV